MSRRKRDPLTLELFVGDPVSPSEKFPPIEFNFYFINQEKIQLRDYQLKTVLRILSAKKNWGVIMPTAMGKTFIALMVIDQFLGKFNKKVLFLAPTRPLCLQHYHDIVDLFDLPEKEIVILSGRIKAEKRKDLWRQGRIFVATPQIVANDLQIHPQLKERVLPENLFSEIGLVIFDEMHRAVKTYAYVKVAKEAHKQKKMILGLTASPGGKAEKIKAIKENLYLDEWLSITLASDEMKKFRVPREEERIRLSLTEPLTNLSELLQQLIEEYYAKLAEADFVPSSYRLLSQEELGKLRKIISHYIDHPPQGTDRIYWLRLISAFSIYYFAFRLQQYLVTENLELFLSFLNKLKGEACREEGRRSLKILVNNPLLQEIESQAQALLEQNWLHPKIESLLNIALKLKNEEKTAIIFCRYIESARALKKYLEKQGFRCGLLFGQKEMSQKKQQEVISQFKEKAFPILISTTVGQEGLHLPLVDWVIHYSVPWNEIEIIQRNGRCGRVKRGKVWVLLMDHPLDLSYFFSALAKKKMMRKQTEKGGLIMEKRIKITGRKETVFPKEKTDKEFLSSQKEGLVHLRLMVSQIEMRVKNERVFLRLIMGDKTGTINVFHWCPEGAKQAQNIMSKLKPGDVAIVLGELKEDERGKAIIVDPKKDQFIVSCEEDFSLPDYQRISRKDPEEMLKEIIAQVRSFKNRYLVKLVLSFLENEEIRKEIISCPAAVTHHHNYYGGLVEHIWELLQLAQAQLKINPQLEADLLLSGVILHDIGKIKTYTATPSTVEISESEKLLGHLTLGVLMVEKAINQIPNFPPLLREKILHLIISHHGELSETKPYLPEAKILAQLDLLNSQTKE
jgi:ERCC4-related helicase/23S rRNA maturation-related 3'-5' exoribonuclease YhaM